MIKRVVRAVEQIRFLRHPFSYRRFVRKRGLVEFLMREIRDLILDKRHVAEITQMPAAFRNGGEPRIRESNLMTRGCINDRLVIPVAENLWIIPFVPLPARQIVIIHVHFERGDIEG